MKKSLLLLTLCITLATARAQNPTFTAQVVPVAGTYAYCVVDMDGDGLDDIVGVTNTNINIQRQLSGGGFTSVNIATTYAPNLPSGSIAAGDIDGNGYTDLLYGGGSGATFMMANNTGTAFTQVTFPQYIFCQRTNMVDINNDGHLDAFSCHDVDGNVYFMNDGSGNLTFNQYGFGNNCGNYGSIWTDYDGDGDIDLFVAKCGCDPVDIMFRNDGGGVFTSVAAALGFADTQQSWSSAWGDFDNDGDMDVMVGSSSFGNGGHKLMRNDGGNFTNVTIGSGFDTFTGYSIEWVPQDFNNDGWIDILGGGKLMLNNGDMTFSQVTVPMSNGPIGDLNNDGFLDVQSGTTVYFNNGNSNHYLKVIPQGTTSNRSGIGAKVRVVAGTSHQLREIRSGDGFRYMSSLTAHFGLGSHATVDSLIIEWPSGTVDVILNPPIDGTLNVVEGVSTSIGGHSYSAEFNVFPNPAEDLLYVTADRDLSNSDVLITDITGKRVLSTTVRNGQVDISSLTPGAYLLTIESGAKTWQHKFMKN